MKHGEELFCSFKTCRNGGVKFRFCTICQVPVAKRNFRQRHMHGMDNRQKKKSVISEGGDEDIMMMASQTTIQASSKDAQEKACDEDHEDTADDAAEACQVAAAKVADSQEMAPRGLSNQQIDTTISPFPSGDENQDVTSTSDAGCYPLSSDRANGNGMHQISELSGSISNNRDRQSSTSLSMEKNADEGKKMPANDKALDRSHPEENMKLAIERMNQEDSKRKSING
jgi:hypothetical protein